MKMATRSLAAWLSLTPVFLLSDPASAASLTTVYTFKGAPTDAFGYNTDLIYQEGLIYGASPLGGPGKCHKRNGACGVIFSLDPSTGDETVLYSFTLARLGKDLGPNLLYSESHLYGTTSEGGQFGYGEVFDFDLKTSKLKVLHSFAGFPTDGSSPSGPLLLLNGSLYGTSEAGGSQFGASICGAVYKVNVTTGAESLIYSFAGGTDGSGPVGGVLYENGLLYGVTVEGGGSGCGISNGCGTIYSIDPAAGVETILHNFGQKADGANPLAAMIYANGVFYGTTAYGGTAKGCSNFRGGCGTVFSFDPTSQAENVLYDFGAGLLGSYITTRLVYKNNALYGTSIQSTKEETPILFRVSLKDAKTTIFVTFPDGGGEANDLLLVGNDLYGTLYGTEDLVFKVTP